jgi:hypothetical protein
MLISMLSTTSFDALQNVSSLGSVCVIFDLVLGTLHPARIFCALHFHLLVFDLQRYVHAFAMYFLQLFI